MDYIRVNKDNLEKEHIYCAISNNKDVQVLSKKAWLFGSTILNGITDMQGETEQ